MPENNPTLLDRLLAAARAEPDVSRLEYAFETRLLARLHEESGPSLFACAWKLCPFFAVLATAAGVWCYLTQAPILNGQRMYVEASRQGEESALLTHFTGEATRP
jgi:hypothetical protein